MAGLVEYPIQLGPDRWAYLRLPSDLNDHDVGRIADMLVALAPPSVASPIASEQTKEDDLSRNQLQSDGI